MHHPSTKYLLARDTCGRVCYLILRGHPFSLFTLILESERTAELIAINTWSRMSKYDPKVIQVYVHHLFASLPRNRNARQYTHVSRLDGQNGAEQLFRLPVSSLLRTQCR